MSFRSLRRVNPGWVILGIYALAPLVATYGFNEPPFIHFQSSVHPDSLKMDVTFPLYMLGVVGGMTTGVVTVFFWRYLRVALFNEDSAS